MSSWRSSVETIRLETTAQGARGASTPLPQPVLQHTVPQPESPPLLPAGALRREPDSPLLLALFILESATLQRTTHRGTSAAYLRYFLPNRCSSAASSSGIWHLSIARTNAPAGSNARGEPSQSACAQSNPAPAR